MNVSDDKQRFIGKTYWHVYLNWKLCCRKRVDHDDSSDRIRFSVGNYFNSLAGAEMVCDSIRELLAEHRAKKRVPVARRPVEKRYYWYLFINEIRPHATETTDRGRIIDSERATIGNYLDKEDAEALSKQIADMLGK